MRSVRLGDNLEERLQEAARISGKPASRIIREAVAEYCEGVLGQRLDRRLGDVVGSVESDGGRAHDTGTAFRRLLEQRKRPAEE
jgi:predicted transcriptional regulator